MSPDLAAAIIKEMAFFADEHELAITGQTSTNYLIDYPGHYRG